ncbi:hypothetical protein [Clostridium gasigenes]|uniref:hypothetical protein n=1 Tax=Clostridium gasigenes TaxID=94869 RepID=UPI001C0C09C2|nr:hypothetical protein [Clostridium gasigenes]MBU3107569.1 hypothetical protein [Clostridium gasigenes]
MNKDFMRWIILNIILPIAPIGLRMFISYMGQVNLKVFEMPELLFSSITISIIALNINTSNKYGIVEQGLLYLFKGIIILDLVVLTMMYCNIANRNSDYFAIVSMVITVLLAPIYKIYYMNKDNNNTVNLNVEIRRAR